MMSKSRFQDCWPTLPRVIRVVLLAGFSTCLALACVGFGMMNISDSAHADSLHVNSVHVNNVFVDSAYVQIARNNTSITVDMPLPGESVEWQMSSGAIDYNKAEIALDVLEVSGNISEVERWVSIDLVDESQSAATVAATGLSLSEFEDWSYDCPESGGAGCTLKATFSLDRGAGDEVREQRIHIRWMFTVEDVALDSSLGTDVDGEGDMGAGEGAGALAITGANVALGAFGVVMLALLVVLALRAVLWRRAVRREVKAQEYER
jgi:hypothetical protein